MKTITTMPGGLGLKTVAELAVDTVDSAPTGAVALMVSRHVLRQLDVSMDVTTGIEDLEVSSVVIQNGYALLLTPAL